MMPEEKKTYTIAVMSGSLQSDYVLEMMKGFHASAYDHKVNTILFLGPQIPANCKEIVDARITENCSVQFSTIYQYTHFIKPDAVIITYGSLSSLLNKQSKDDFLDMLSGIPCLMLEDEFPGRDVPCITADNYNGMCQCIRHLVGDHGFTRISFLSGPKDNYDANERLRAYLDTMAEYNIPVTEGMVAYGNFSDHQDEQVEFLLEKNPDLQAIACADDMMAKACYRVCEKKNIIVGKDLAITGFDDSNMASTMNPPLTSISQNVYEIGYTAMSRAVSMCRGETIRSEKMPTILRKRSSCSCQPLGFIDYSDLKKHEINLFLLDVLRDLSPCVFDALEHSPARKHISAVLAEYCEYIASTILDGDGSRFDPEALQKIFKEILDIPFFFKDQFLDGIMRFLIILKDNAPNPQAKKLLNHVITTTNTNILSYNIRTLEKKMYESSCKAWFIPLYIGNLIKGLYMYNPEEIFTSVMEEMQKMSFMKSYFLLFDRPISCESGETLSFPKNMNLVAYFNENEMKYVGMDPNYQVTYDNGFVSFIDGQDPMELTMVILFSDNKQYGLLLCDVADEDIGFVQICGLQFGTLLNFMELYRIEQKTQDELQSSLQVIREQNRILSFLSKYDGLTQLLNRRGFIEDALSLYRNNEGRRGYLIFGDLDHLKEINDFYGHVEGDFAIMSIAHRFQQILPPDSVIGRIGGDEMIAFVLTDEINFKKRIEKQFMDVAEKFNQSSEKPYYVEASIGIHGFDCHPDVDFNEMLKMSDKVLYQSKENRRSSVVKENFSL